MQLGMTSTVNSKANKLTPYVIVEVDEPGKQKIEQLVA